MIGTYAECADFVRSALKDEDMRAIVFGYRGDLSGRDLRIGGIPVMRSLINMEFALIYMKWASTHDRVLREHCSRSRHFQNVHRALGDLYRYIGFDLDEAIYVISEVRKDIAERNESSLFYGYINADSPCKLSKIFNMIYDWIKGRQSSDINIDVLAENLGSLLESFDGVMNCRYYPDDNGNPTFSIGNDTLQHREFVYIDANGKMYLLAHHFKTESSINSVYMSLDGQENITIIE